MKEHLALRTLAASGFRFSAMVFSFCADKDLRPHFPQRLIVVMEENIALFL